VVLQRLRKTAAWVAASIYLAPRPGPIGIPTRTRLRTGLGPAPRRLAQVASTVAAAPAPLARTEAQAAVLTTRRPPRALAVQVQQAVAVLARTTTAATAGARRM
jgi:hypothetical protein